MRAASLLACLLIAAVSCSRPSPQAKPPSADAQATPGLAPVAAIDACQLLTSDEIAAVQGAAVTAATSDKRSQDGLPISQCYFALPTTSDSLSLIVYKKPAQAVEKTPAILWKEMFHTERPVKIGREGKPKIQPTPQKIEGVGDEAFWGGGQFGGTLHVLKGEDVFQLSVGGPGDEAKKVEALKRLAVRIAERL